MANEPARQENAVARALGGRRVRGSGSGIEKGDSGVGRSFRDHWMVECKQTKHDFIRFELLWWQKLLHDCLQELKRPLCHLQIAGASVFVLDISDWEEMLTLSKPTGFVAKRLPANEKSFRLNALAWNEFYKKHQILNPYKIAFWSFKLDKYLLVLVDESVFMRVFEAAYGKSS